MSITTQSELHLDAGRVPNSSGARVYTHSFCSTVSGTGRPRAVLMRSNVSVEFSPEAISTDAAIRDDLPLPDLQCKPTFFPDVSAPSSLWAKAMVDSRDAGTSRSRMGKDMNSMP